MGHSEIPIHVFGAARRVAWGNTKDPRVAGTLVAVLRDPDPQVRGSAADALGKIGDPRAVEALIGALQDINRAVRKSAAMGLKGLGWNPNNEVEAAYYFIAAGEHHKCVELGTTAVAPLIKVLRNRDRDDRAYACNALGNIRDASAVEPLIEALRDEDKRDVRETAAGALGWIGDARAVEALIAAADAIGKPAISALGMIGDPRAVEKLIQALNNSWAVGLSETAAEALGKIGDPRAVEPLSNIIDDTSKPASRRDAALEALKKIEDPQAKRKVETVLGEKEKARVVAEAAAATLENSGFAELVDSLVRMYQDNPRGLSPGDADEGLVRAIGQRLYGLGGDSTMSNAHAAFSSRMPQFARNLEHVWNGIGSWMG